jgi:hypothetical protein
MAVVIWKGAAARLHLASGEGVIHGPWKHLGVAGSSLLLLGGGIGGLESGTEGEQTREAPYT